MRTRDTTTGVTMGASRGDHVAVASHQANNAVVENTTVSHEQIRQNCGRQQSSSDVEQLWAAAALQAPHLHTLLSLENEPDGPAAYQNAPSMR